MELILISIFISVLALDITIAFQVLISSPIFAGPLLGWLLGDIWLGFEMGFLFQLFWLSKIPAGAYIVPEGNIASMIAIALVLLLRKTGFPNTTLAIIFIEAILVSYMGALLTLFYRKFNGKILNLMIKEVESVHFKILLFLEVGSMFIYFLGVFLLTYLTISLSLQFIPGLVELLGSHFKAQFIIVKPVMVGIGLVLVYPILREAIHKNPGNKFEKR
jgi:mannose/fructose/N-acetylgalactosamine-specific phosphotransferase system component IIC